MAKPTTTVEITFLVADADRAMMLIPFQEDSSLVKDGRMKLMFYDCDPEPWWLTRFGDACIPYTFDYGSGEEWRPGVEHFRFDENGDPQTKVVDDDNKNPSIKDLVTLLETPQALVEFIKLHIENTTPIPWDNQEEYSKRARLKKLVTSP